MEKIIFFGLIIPILIFVIYLAGRAIRTGFNAKNANQSDLEIDSKDNQENLISEINKLNELLKDGVLTQDEFEKAKKKILDK